MSRPFPCLIPNSLVGDQPRDVQYMEAGITREIRKLEKHADPLMRVSSFRLFNDGTGDSMTDFVIKCGNREWNVHRAILALRSNWFKSRFESKDEGVMGGVLNIEANEPEAVGAFFEFLYTRYLPQLWVWELRDYHPDFEKRGYATYDATPEFYVQLIKLADEYREEMLEVWIYRFFHHDQRSKTHRDAFWQFTSRLIVGLYELEDSTFIKLMRCVLVKSFADGVARCESESKPKDNVWNHLVESPIALREVSKLIAEVVTSQNDHRRSNEREGSGTTVVALEEWMGAVEV